MMTDFDESWPNQTIHYKATFINASVILILHADWVQRELKFNV